MMSVTRTEKSLHFLSGNPFIALQKYVNPVLGLQLLF